MLEPGSSDLGSPALTAAFSADPALVWLTAGPLPTGRSLRQAADPIDASARRLGLPGAPPLWAELALGLAAGGLHPVVSVPPQTPLDDLLALLQSTDELAHCLPGQPAVFWLPCTLPLLAALEPALLRLAGPQVVLASSLDQAQRLLAAAVEAASPVVLLVPQENAAAPAAAEPLAAQALGQAVVARPGTDLTLLAWGAMTRQAVAIAGQLEATDDVQAEVLDLVSLQPLDVDTILGSVQKTGRCLILEATTTMGGIAAELAAQIAEQDLLWLLAPIGRVQAQDNTSLAIGPSLPIKPNNARVLAAARRLLAYE